jgi:hypothetical protein
MRLLGLLVSVVLVRILLSFRNWRLEFGVLCVSYLATKSDRLVGLVLPSFNANTGPLSIYMLCPNMSYSSGVIGLVQGL